MARVRKRDFRASRRSRGYRSLVRRVICPQWSCADSEI